MLTEGDSLNHDAMIDLAELAPAFSFIAAKGFVLNARDYKPQEFGNAIVVMAGPIFSLRFMRDRDQIFIDAGSDEAGWHKLEYVLEFVDNSVSQEQLGEPPDPSTLAKLLQLNWEAVTSLFGNQRRISELQDFSRQKSTDFVGRLFARGKGSFSKQLPQSRH